MVVVMISWLMWKIFSSDVLEQELLYQGYTRAIWEIGVETFPCRSLHLLYKRGYGVNDRSDNLAHNSQNSQNHTPSNSLELGIVVKRVVLALLLFCFLLCCCSPVVQQGYCSFAYSFAVKACQIPRILIIDFLQMDGSIDHQLDLQKVPNQKNHQQESLVSSSDPGMIIIHM